MRSATPRSLQSCHTVSMMVVGRFVVGLGVGLASCIVPLYIGELAPTKIRGRLVVLNNVAITLGQLVAYGQCGRHSAIPFESERRRRGPLTYSYWRNVPVCPGRMEMDGRVGCFAFDRPAPRAGLATRIAYADLTILCAGRKS
jgi:hypothetical protein